MMGLPNACGVDSIPELTIFCDIQKTPTIICKYKHLRTFTGLRENLKPHRFCDLQSWTDLYTMDSLIQ